MRLHKDFNDKRVSSSTVATILLTLGYMYSGIDEADAETCACTCCSDNQEFTQKGRAGKS
jgi:hypothetical protein